MLKEVAVTTTALLRYTNGKRVFMAVDGSKRKCRWYWDADAVAQLTTGGRW